MDRRLGIIGGNGWLGNAIGDAVLATGFIDASHLTVSARSANRGKVELPGATWTTNNAELARRSDVIVISVRPEQFSAVEIAAPGKLIVSVMAGVPCSTIAQRTGSSRIVRTMPNAAASSRTSFTPYFAGGDVPDDDKRFVDALLQTFGFAAEVPTERHLDYCAGLTGAGAAFPALLAQAMLDHAVAQGLSVEFARAAAEGVVVHAAQLIAGHDPREIVAELVAYRGTTAAAIEAMEGHGFTRAVHAGLDAALKRSEAMARS